MNEVTHPIIKEENEQDTFTCHLCQQTKPVGKELGTGYGVDKDDNKICYECCGKQDAEKLKNMLPGEKTTLFFKKSESEVINWPGTLTIKPTHVTTSRHNFGGEKTHIWFTFEGHNFYGYQIGDMNEVCHIKKLKK